MTYIIYAPLSKVAAPTIKQKLSYIFGPASIGFKNMISAKESSNLMLTAILDLTDNDVDFFIFTEDTINSICTRNRVVRFFNNSSDLINEIINAFLVRGVIISNCINHNQTEFIKTIDKVKVDTSSDESYDSDRKKIASLYKYFKDVNKVIECDSVKSDGIEQIYIITTNIDMYFVVQLYGNDITTEVIHPTFDIEELSVSETYELCTANDKEK